MPPEPELSTPVLVVSVDRITVSVLYVVSFAFSGLSVPAPCWWVPLHEAKNKPVHNAAIMSMYFISSSLVIKQVERLFV